MPSLLACHYLTLLRKSVMDINENSVVQGARLQTFRPYSKNGGRCANVSSNLLRWLEIE